MTLPKIKLPRFINNKYVLYLTLVLAIVNVIGFLNVGDNQSLLLFVVTGVLSSYFSKNMIVNLGVAMLVANCMFCKNMLLEGFKEGKDDEEEDESQMDIAKDAAKKMLSGLMKEEKDEKEPKKCGNKICKKNQICKNGTCVGSSKKSGFTQRNVPSSSPSKANHDDDDEAPGDRVDYAATLEGAYENLQKMLGDGGMKGLTSETKRLVDQQKNLMDSLNNMAPVLNSAKATLENLQMPDVKQIEQLMKGVTGKK